jgi:hypothetical protein
MINPGIVSPGTQVGDWVEDMQGALAVLAHIRLAYGSGGSTIKAYLQTSADQGVTPVDIACCTFATASAVKVRNLSALTPKTTDVVPTDGTLADDTSVDGVLGDRFRLKIVSTGTYGGSTTLSGRLCAR